MVTSISSPRLFSRIEWSTTPVAMLTNEPSTSSASAYSHDTGADGMEKDDMVPPRPTTANPFRRTGSISSTLAWRRRPKSLALNIDAAGGSPSIGRQHTLTIEENTTSPVENSDAMRPGISLTGKIRRASLSLVRGIVHRRDRRSSEPCIVEDDSQPMRPATAYSAWHKLRQAASFRHSRSSHVRGGLETIYSPLEATFPDVVTPGNGLEPPVIPHHTGHAAKAAVALQNQYLSFSQPRRELLREASLNDRESGIGIAITTPETDPTCALSMDQDSSICRVDFISQLPLELAVQILVHLDATNLTAAARVSRTWHELSRDQHIWRQSFLREKTGTFATGQLVPSGTGMGIPPTRPGNDWQKIYKAKQGLDKKWREGNQASSVYLNGHTDSIYCLQFDESKIITGSRDKTIRIWDMHTFQCRLIIGPPEVVTNTSILFDSMGKPVHFASGTDSDRSQESVPATVSFPTHHKASILCLQYDDGILVTGSSDSSCIVYNMKSGYRPIRRLEYHTAAVLDLAFDDKHIVTCSKDISICVWDRNTGAFLKQLKGHTGPVNAVQMRGNTIVSCSGDFRVKLWNIDSGKVIREFIGHTKGLACSQFSDDGRYIASAGSDKVIRIWDANTGECIREIQAHDSLVRSLHIDSVSGRLISGSYDTDIKVFDMETGDQLLDFPRWHASWVLSAKSDYRRIVSTGQDPKILIMDFGAEVEDIELLESTPKEDVARGAGFI